MYQALHPTLQMLPIVTPSPIMSTDMHDVSNLFQNIVDVVDDRAIYIINILVSLYELHVCSISYRPNSAEAALAIQHGLRV